jgi:hypothetical protein
MEATGPLYLLDGEHSIISRKVYTAMPDETEIEEFKKRCGPDGGELRNLNPTRIKIKIFELDLVNNS